jgi:lysine-specific demethylase 3
MVVFESVCRLRYSQKGFLTIAGFSEPAEAEESDVDPWLPHTPVIHPKLDVDTAKFIVTKVGDKFCELVEQEKECRSWVDDNGESELLYTPALFSHVMLSFLV